MIRQAQAQGIAVGAFLYAVLTIAVTLIAGPFDGSWIDTFVMVSVAGTIWPALVVGVVVATTDVPHAYSRFSSDLSSGWR